MSLLAVTSRLLSKAPRHLDMKSIANESGVPYRWLCDFANDRIYDPGVRKVQNLHDYLVRFPAMKPTKYKWSEIVSTILPEIPGLYEIYAADGLPIYFGETKSLSRRMGEHARSKDILDLEPAYVRFTEIKQKDERLWLEDIRVKVYGPVLNVAGKGAYCAGRHSSK
jgi:hypothetical protein